MRALFTILFISAPAMEGANPNIAHDLSEQGHEIVSYLSRESWDGDMTCLCNAFAAFHDKKLHVYRYFTNAHCVLDKKNQKLEKGVWYIHFKPNSGVKKTYTRATLVALGNIASGFDFAIFDVPDEEIAERDIPLMPFGTRKARENESVLMISSTSTTGFPILTHIGNVKNEDLEYSELVDGVSWQHAMVIIINVNKGASGAPIISLEQNAIVGILIGKFNSWTAVALPIQRLLQFWRRVCNGEDAVYRLPTWKNGECRSQAGL